MRQEDQTSQKPDCAGFVCQHLCKRIVDRRIPSFTRGTLATMVLRLFFLFFCVSIGNGLHPNCDGLEPSSDGLQSRSDGLQPKSDGLWREPMRDVKELFSPERQRLLRGEPPELPFQAPRPRWQSFPDPAVGSLLQQKADSAVQKLQSCGRLLSQMAYVFQFDASCLTLRCFSSEPEVWSF